MYLARRAAGWFNRVLNITRITSVHSVFHALLAEQSANAVWRIFSGCFAIRRPNYASPLLYGIVADQLEADCQVRADEVDQLFEKGLSLVLSIEFCESVGPRQRRWLD